MENTFVLENLPNNPKCQKNISMNEDIALDRGTVDKKGDLNNKLSDSACGSLNESEDSEIKCPENESNLEDPEEEMDSLECDVEHEFEETDDEEGEDEEEESIDNNTFNVINTENSESQEISELTNDDSSGCDKTKENEARENLSIEMEGKENSEKDSVFGITTSENGTNHSPEPGSLEHKLNEENATFDPSFEDESSKSQTSEDPAMEISTDSSVKIGVEKNYENLKVKVDKSFHHGLKSIPSRENEIRAPNNSPKTRKRLTHPNSKTNEFTVEIYESKRRSPEVVNILRPLESTESTDQHHLTVQTDLVNNMNNIILINPPNVDSEQGTHFDYSPQGNSRASMEALSPDIGDRSNDTMKMDARDTIQEESEDSDLLSLIRSSTEDTTDPDLATGATTISNEDISRKKSQTEAVSPQTSRSHPSKTHGTTTPTTPPPPTTTPKAPPDSTQPDNTPTTTAVSRRNDESCPEPSPTETKKPTPMAFTIDLDSAASDSSTSGNSTKKLDITASISQWAPKHRRNLSLTKVEEHKKVEERPASEKPPVGRPRSGTVGAGPPVLGPKRAGVAGYHSEGYFSSDQDEDSPKRPELKSPRSPRTPDALQPPHTTIVRSNSQESSKGASVRMRPPSPLSPTTTYGAPLTETASFLIEKMMNATPETKRKFGSKPEGRTCCKERERKPSVSELTGKSFKGDKKMGAESKKQAKNSPTENIDPLKNDKDDVSEAGTYTIDKDSPSPEEDQARNDIDGVFGVTTESEAELTSTTTAVPVSTTDLCPEDESSWMSANEIPPSISRNSPNWIQQWAAHVAEQTKPQLEPVPPLPKSSLTSPRGQKLPIASHENDSRPRRKLPTPPSHINTSTLSPRNDQASYSNQRFWRDKTLSNELTSDTEAYLRDTQNLVSSLQARVDKTKGENGTFRNTSFESHESGGDSDFDTSVSYPFNDEDRLAPSLKSKLRLTGLLPTSKNAPSPSPGVVSPRRPESAVNKDPKLKKSCGGGIRDPNYEGYSQRRDDRVLHSDSSSEASEPYKDLSRAADKNPPLKFNRAFSLRRARLGCEDPVSTPLADKKKIARPSSAGAAVSTRKATLGNTKSYQGVDSPTVSSPRSCGFGSPRGIPPSSQGGGSKGPPPSDIFDRTDGGRFSLRLATTGSSTINTVKSPSKNSVKKEPSGNKKNAARSNSTLSSKEVDFQNWKRRKSYDPMKAAAEGRKKQVEKKLKNTQLPPPTTNPENRSPSPPSSLLRSASFHGTEGVISNLRWTRKGCSNHPHYTSEDDGPYSLEEEMGPHPSPRHGSPLHRSPTSPHQLCQSPARQQAVTLRSRRPSLGLSDEVDPQYQASLRKISLDESGSEGKRSPLNSASRGPGNSVSASGRPKTKMEALDNLVISTIHSLSVKVRSTSESLLQKLKSHFDEEGDRAALLEEVLSHLSESDQSLASGQTRSTSRELAGILRNLKKIEHALEVIDKVIIIGDEEYREDDIDYVPNEWVEVSDY